MTTTRGHCTAGKTSLRSARVPEPEFRWGSADVTVAGGRLYVNTDDPACGFKCDTSSGTIAAVLHCGGAHDMSAHCARVILALQMTAETGVFGMSDLKLGRGATIHQEPTKI
jgi:hypothetical protein